jgi:hypothetical protein
LKYPVLQELELRIRHVQVIKEVAEEIATFGELHAEFVLLLARTMSGTQTGNLETPVAGSEFEARPDALYSGAHFGATFARRHIGIRSARS